MATYYVRKTGNNGSAGTSPATAWLTIGKALTTMGSGDTVYIGAGVYRETVSVTITPTAETFVIADVDGSQTGDLGEVRWTAYTTNDKSAPSSSTLLNLSGKDHLTFRYITFVGGSGDPSILNATTATSTNIKFQDCTFIDLHNADISQYSMFRIDAASATALDWIIERCRFVSTNHYAFRFDSLTADEAWNVIVRNCLFTGYNGYWFYFSISSGSGGGSGPGDFKIYNNTFMGGANQYTVYTSGVSTTNPIRVYNNIFNTENGLFSDSLGSIVEDYNFFNCKTDRSNVSTGSNSKDNTNHSCLLHIGQEYHQGKLGRPMFTPTVDSPMLGFGNNATYTDSVDILNRPRPSGAGITWTTANKAIGCYERHDFGTKETTTFDASGTSLKMTGPGDQELLIPVNAQSTTVSIKVRRDGTYSGSNPQIILLANGEIGVTTQTVTDAGSANAWNTLTLSAFTPTAKGWVTLRLSSRDTNGGGVTYWDTLSVS